MALPLVQGYHGTSYEAAHAILEKGFRLSANDYDWLGDGVYFFQDARQRAWAWARERCPPPHCVLGAEIALEGCIDLLDIGWAGLLAEAYDSFIGLYKAAGQPLPLQKGGAHRLDRYVLNYACQILEEGGQHVCSVRAAFVEGAPIFPNSALFNQAHVQIAVRDVSVIGRVWASD